MCVGQKQGSSTAAVLALLQAMKQEGALRKQKSALSVAFDVVVKPMRPTFLQLSKEKESEPNVYTCSAAVSACVRGAEWVRVFDRTLKWSPEHFQIDVGAESAPAWAKDEGKGAQWREALDLLDQLSDLAKSERSRLALLFGSTRAFQEKVAIVLGKFQFSLETLLVVMLVEVEELTTVRALKLHLQTLPEVGVPRFRQRLLHEGRNLEDDEALSAAMDLQFVLLPFAEISREREEVDQLIVACQNGNASEVEEILKRPQWPDYISGSHRDTPMTAASGRGFPEIVSLLLEAAADINKNCAIYRKDTPLGAATSNGQLEVVQLLLEKGANRHKRSGALDETPLELACQRGETEIVRLLLEDVSSPDHLAKAFLYAAEGHASVIRQLLAARADIDRRTQGQTALVQACRKGHKEVVRTLLAAGADKDKPGSGSPLYEACRNDHAEIMGLLLEAGAHPDRGAPLSWASSAGKTEMVRALLSARADVNGAFGLQVSNSPLLEAVRKDQAEVVQLLLEARADPNRTQKPHIETALGDASKRGNSIIVKSLLRARADQDRLCSPQDETPLGRACDHGHHEIVVSLLGARASCNQTSRESTPLLLASTGNHTDTVRLLLAANADANAIGKDKVGRGETALGMASGKGNVDIARMLLGASADTEKLGRSDGPTPL
ncbi:mask, partial [Symbiodinium pilosum]